MHSGVRGDRRCQSAKNLLEMVRPPTASRPRTPQETSSNRKNRSAGAGSLHEDIWTDAMQGASSEMKNEETRTFPNHIQMAIHFHKISAARYANPKPSLLAVLAVLAGEPSPLLSALALAIANARREGEKPLPSTESAHGGCVSVRHRARAPASFAMLSGDLPARFVRCGRAPAAKRTEQVL